MKSAKPAVASTLSCVETVTALARAWLMVSDAARVTGKENFLAGTALPMGQTRWITRINVTRKMQYSGRVAGDTREKGGH